jgi:hypothetical protein
LAHPVKNQAGQVTIRKHASIVMRVPSWKPHGVQQVFVEFFEDQPPGSFHEVIILFELGVQSGQNARNGYLRFDE